MSLIHEQFGGKIGVFAPGSSGVFQLGHTPLVIGGGGSGGAVSVVDGITIHQFLNVGTSTFTATTALTIDYLIVAGGGAGGGRHGGGGAGGGLIYKQAVSLSAGTYSVVVGAGGSRANSNVRGPNGANSSFNGETAIGGGGGGTYSNPTGKAGGSGGGAGSTAGTCFGGLATPGQGFDGGYHVYVGDQRVCGGGGGAGGSGVLGTNLRINSPGHGGMGFSCDITGTILFWAGGGGGGVWASTADAGSGGLGGGGGGAHSQNGAHGSAGAGGTGGLNAGTAGTGGLGNTGGDGGANTGGGGGGNGQSFYSNYTSLGGGLGGSGIVVIRYRI